MSVVIYKVECPSCGRPFDAMTALVCNCLDQVRTVRCANCAACLCRAPEKIKSTFLAAAPRELMARLRSTHAPAAVAAAPAAGDIKRPLVLFADDDPSARAIAQRVVGSSGYGVILAKAGNEALKLAREYTPEMVITDSFMPGIDGRQLSKMIKTEMPKVKIAVVTSVYKDSRYKHEALRDFEVDDYHSKPLSPVDLRALLQKHLPR